MATKPITSADLDNISVTVGRFERRLDKLARRFSETRLPDVWDAILDLTTAIDALQGILEDESGKLRDKEQQVKIEQAALYGGV